MSREVISSGIIRKAILVLQTNKMFGLRSFISGTLRARTVLSNVPTPLRVQKFGAHHEGPPQPFDNLPFSVQNRYVATVFFSVFFGIGLWAPFLIVWYSMAKRSM